MAFGVVTSPHRTGPTGGPVLIVRPKWHKAADENALRFDRDVGGLMPPAAPAG